MNYVIDTLIVSNFTLLVNYISRILVLTYTHIFATIVDMNAITYNQPKINVYMDGELTKEFEPSLIDKLNDYLKRTTYHLSAYLAQEVQMIIFDTLHGTHYRRTKHRLARKQKRLEFEARIGLVRV